MASQNPKGVLYGVGVGPGDPELLTLKAVRVLSRAAIIAAPDSGSGSGTALSIVEEYIRGKTLWKCPAPMTRDPQKLEQVWEESCEAICSFLEQGKDVAFITLGDPAIYSTYFYIHRRVQLRGYETQLVPGVPSFCAAAAKLGISLCEKEERLLIVPASNVDMEESLSLKANKVLMKSGRQLTRLKEQLKQRGELDRAALVCNCGLDGEVVCPDLSDFEGNAGYFSLVIVKDQ